MSFPTACKSGTHSETKAVHQRPCNEEDDDLVVGADCPRAPTPTLTELHHHEHLIHITQPHQPRPSRPPGITCTSSTMPLSESSSSDLVIGESTCNFMCFEVRFLVNFWRHAWTNFTSGYICNVMDRSIQGRLSTRISRSGRSGRAGSAAASAQIPDELRHVG